MQHGDIGIHIGDWSTEQHDDQPPVVQHNTDAQPERRDDIADP